MLYQLIDWQRQGLDLWLANAAQWAKFPGFPSAAAASIELIQRTTSAFDSNDLPLEVAIARDLKKPVSIAVVQQTPFCRLVRVHGNKSDRSSLLIAPHSGYATSVLSELIVALLGYGDVYVTDWIDARHIPADHGPFGLTEQVNICLDALSILPNGPNLVAFSQSGFPALATAAIAKQEQAAIRSLILLGAPIDGSNTFEHWRPLLDTIDNYGIDATDWARVPLRFAGHGRPVVPSVLQLLTFVSANPKAYVDVQSGLWFEQLTGEQSGYERMHADVHRLIDVPAELHQDMLAVIRDGARAGLEILRSRGIDIDLEALSDVPLCSIEAADDELVGQNATHAAHALTRSHSLHQDVLKTVTGAAHQDLFTGPIFRAKTATILSDFLVGATI